MAGKVDRVMEILGLWLIAIIGILELPQYFPFPLNIRLVIIVTAAAAIGITLFLCLGETASEAHMKRQEERMRLVYGPLYSAVSSMRQGENDPHRKFSLGTRFNPWTDYPEIMQKVIDVFVNCPDLVENDRVSNGWADNESKLRTRDFWLGGKEVYAWFDAIEEEFHRIDSELRARSSSS